MSISASWPSAGEREIPPQNKRSAARSVASEAWQQEQHTQLNSCLVRFEYDVSQRLGQHTLQKLQNCGLDVLRSGRENLQQLIQQLHEIFQLERGASLSFQRRSSCFPSPDKPGYVVDVYAYLHLPERDIVALFLRQRAVYKVMLEQLTDHLVRYIEKAYYRIEQHWQEFQSHYMAVGKLEYLGGSRRSVAGGLETENAVAGLHDIALEERGVIRSVDGTAASKESVSEGEDFEPEAAASGGEEAGQGGATASQIALRHQRIQQLQGLARSFWQDNFAFALAQVQLDLPAWALEEMPGVGATGFTETLETRLGVERVLDEYADAGQSRWAGRQQRVDFAVYYISILKELEQRCNLQQQRHQLMSRLRGNLEQSLKEEDLALDLQAGASTEPGPQFAICYREYGEDGNAEIDRPDELVNLDLRYFSKQSLLIWERQKEEIFIHLSKAIHRFFGKVEKATRFRRLTALALAWQSKFGNRLRSQSASTAYRVERNPAVEALLQSDVQLFPDTFAAGEGDLDSADSPSVGRAVELSSASLQNQRYEARLLLELLQKADVALQQQIQFRPEPRSYALLRQSQELRRELLAICCQPLSAQSLGNGGILLTASYRTVARRRESGQRVDRVLQNFNQRCQQL